MGTWQHMDMHVDMVVRLPCTSDSAHWTRTVSMYTSKLRRHKPQCTDKSRASMAAQHFIALRRDSTACAARYAACDCVAPHVQERAHPFMCHPRHDTPQRVSVRIRCARLRRRLLHHRLRLRLLLRLHGRRNCRGPLLARVVDPAASLAVPDGVGRRRLPVRLRDGSCCDGGLGGAELPAHHVWTTTNGGARTQKAIAGGAASTWDTAFGHFEIPEPDSSALIC